MKGDRVNTGLCEDIEPLEEYDWAERVEATDPLKPEGPNVFALDVGEMSPCLSTLFALVGVSSESRLEE